LARLHDHLGVRIADEADPLTAFVDLRAASKVRRAGPLPAVTWLGCACVGTLQLTLVVLIAQIAKDTVFAAVAAGAVAATGVALTLALLHAGGTRLGALVAALPLVSMPTLAWLAFNEPTVVVARTAEGALAATLVTALLVAIGCTMYRPGKLTVVIPVLPCRTLLTIAVAGTLGGAVVYARVSVSPAACGALAALPVVGTMTLLHVAITGGRSALASALRGYLRGSLTSATFFGSLALALTSVPPPAAWLLSLVLAALVPIAAGFRGAGAVAGIK